MVSVRRFWWVRMTHRASFAVATTLGSLVLLALGSAVTMPPRLVAASALRGQVSASDKPKQEVRFTKGLQVLGRTNDGYMFTFDKYPASDGNEVCVTIFYLRSYENAKRKFDAIVSSASETIEHNEYHDEKSGVLIRRAVLRVSDPKGRSRMILSLPASSSELYEISSSSLDDVLEFERQKLGYKDRAAQP
jgi:hypothetical protein